jgi:hypothetical protein
MNAPDEQTSPARKTNLPEPSRNFTTPELEAVIRRALELQSNASARADESLSEADVVRIGQELGLDAATVRRAMAEVHGRPVEKESGALVALAGNKTVRVSRVIPRDAASVGALIDRLLREIELMVPERRSGNRIHYEKNPSLAAMVSRVTQNFSRSEKPLKLDEIDVVVSAIDENSTLVELSVNFGDRRSGIVAGVIGSSTVASGVWATIVWGTAIVDPLMWLGLPVIAGSLFGSRAIYRSIFRSAEDRMESFLDRVERG